MRFNVKKIIINIFSSAIMVRKFFIVLFFLIIFSKVYSQTTQVQFGQNRVQYHPFDWQYYNSDNFTIYFYPGGQEIGKFVWTVAEMKLKALDKQMDFHYRSQIDILVYNDISDLAQTNIGLGQEDFNIGGTAIFRDNKLFLHFDGNHRHLQRDLMKGLSELYIRQMMAGKNIGQKIQNAILLSMPTWYRNGLSAYMGEPWNTAQDAKLKQYLQTAKKSSFTRFVGINPEMAGQSFWYMISEMYGRDAIPNILYLTRVNHSVNSGFVNAINARLDDLMKDWIEFYSSRYQLDNKERDSISGFASNKIKKRNNADVGDLKISADGKYAAYAAFDGGFYKVFLLDLKTKKAKKIAKGGFRSDQYPFDKSYPILTWTKSGHKLAIISDKRDIIRLTQIDFDKKEKSKSKIIKFKRVYGADYTNNPNVLIFSGQNKGQTDLYLYNTLNKNATQLNNDNYDDLYPKYVNWNGNDGVLFSSNRIEDKLYFTPSDTVLPTQTLDLFFYDLNKRGADVSRVTETPFANEIGIGNYNSSYYSFLSDENGINNQYVGILDSFFVKNDTVETIINEDTDSAQTIKQAVDIYKLKGVTFPITNFANGIEQAAVTTQKSYYFFGTNKKKTYIYSKQNFNDEEIESSKTFGLRNTSFRKFYRETNLDVSASNKNTSNSNTDNNTTSSNLKNEVTLDSLYNAVTKYTFESDFNTTISSAPNTNATPKKDTTTFSVEVIQFDKPKEDDTPPPFLQGQPVAANTSNINVEKTTGQKIRILPYRARFTSDYVVAQVDNSVIGSNYQSYGQNGSRYNYPDFGAMISFGVSDLMEDHKIIGGFRLPFTTLTGNGGLEAYAKYINLKKRIDKSLTYYWRSDKYTYELYDINGVLIPSKSARTAKTRTNLFDVSFSYPFDVTKSLRWAITYRNESTNYAYVDQVSFLEKDLKENWISGKVEFVHDNTKQIQFNILNGFRYKIFGEYFFNANNKKSNTFNIGFDIRHYQKIYRNIIWANRFAGANSFGQQKIAYFLGGVDSWIFPKYDYSIPVDESQNYGMQASVTNLRGLPQNIRNGNNYLLWNSEVRIPIFSFFAKKPIKSAFIRDFQLIGFFDAGIAYNFANPFNKDNSLSTEVVVPNENTTPVIVTVNYYRNPLVFGTGGGVRTNILGYFVRLDIGCGYNGLEFNKKPMFHFSLSKDF